MTAASATPNAAATSSAQPMATFMAAGAISPEATARRGPTRAAVSTPRTPSE